MADSTTPQNSFAFAYPKPLRFPDRPAPRKTPMGEKDAAFLLSGRVTVEEKMDGTQVNCRADRFVLCAEDLRQVHSIRYRIPARFVVFDVFDVSSGQFLDPDAKIEVIRHFQSRGDRLPGEFSAGIFPVWEIGRGKYSFERLCEMADEKSPYPIDGKIEGIVVKPARILFYEEHLCGKIIRPEFEGGIEDNYLTRPPEYNQINPAFFE